MSRWGYKLHVRSPENPETEKWEVGIADWMIQKIRVARHQSTFARLRCVKEVADDTLVIYRGWKRPGKSDCFVYVGLPANDHYGLRTTGPPAKIDGRPALFLVFILPDATIDLWTWRAASVDDPGTPEEIEGELIWRKT